MIIITTIIIIMITVIETKLEIIQPLGPSETKPTDITQGFHAGAQDECDIGLQDAIRSERLPKLKTMIAGRRFGESRELAIIPREVARVHDHTTDRGPVTTDPFRGRVHHDIRTVLNGIDQEATHTKRIVHKQRDAMSMRNGCQLLKIGLYDDGDEKTI